MARKHQNWGFTYLANGRGKNIITNSFKESEEEFIIPCFNGFSFFEINGKFYTMTYPRIECLTNEQKEMVEEYCGYYPSAGEYGVIVGTFGEINQCEEIYYEYYCKTYKIKK